MACYHCTNSIVLRCLDPLQLAVAPCMDYRGFSKTLRSVQWVDQKAVTTKHPTLNRLITVREAARIQSFPDQCVCSFSPWRKSVHKLLPCSR